MFGLKNKKLKTYLPKLTPESSDRIDLFYLEKLVVRARYREKSTGK